MEHNTQFAYGLGAILALAIIISGIRYFSNKAENKAFAMLDQGFAKYEAIVKNKGQEKAYKEVQNDFEQILKKYSGKEGGKIASLIYANICYKAGESDKAIALYQKALKDFTDNQFIKVLIFSGLGYSHEEKKEYKAAIKYFNLIASAPGSSLKDEALFNLGRLYAEMGDGEKSREAFKKIISDHPDSIYVELIKEKISG